MGFWKRRKLRKIARELFHHARSLRRLREDLLPAAEVVRSREVERQLTAAIHANDENLLAAACEQAHTLLVALTPVKPHAWLRENAEVLLVAMGIAMAFRAYVAQPFKIPTGSMQPTLYGIHYSPRPYQIWRDAYPMRLANWLLTGEWHTRFTAQAYGTLRGPLGSDGTSSLYEIGGVLHALPRNLVLLVQPGDNVNPGQVLAEGVKINGDHIFVNRLIWNFRAPRRGEIMVFSTDNIPTLSDKKTHYIKRMVGLPGESIS
ncbi:MAG: S26 family signal peptidase, partial [bacterium]